MQVIDDLNTGNDVKFFEETPGLNNNVVTDAKLIKILLKIDKSIEKLLKKSESDDVQSAKLLKWRHAALVLDTLFLYISIVYLVITFISIVMAVPNLYIPN